MDAGEAGSSTQTAKILNNIIYGGSTAGINLASSATVQGNLIIDNQIGISVRSEQDTSVLNHNTIIDNKIGLRTPASGTKVNNNNFEKNTENNLVAIVDVTNNWWGNTDSSVIDNKILDNTDDLTWAKQ